MVIRCRWFGFDGKYSMYAAWCTHIPTQIYILFFYIYVLKYPPVVRQRRVIKWLQCYGCGICVCACVLYVHCGWRGHYIYMDLYIETSAYFGIEILTQEMGRKRKCKSNIYKIYTPHPPTSTFPLYTLHALLDDIQRPLRLRITGPMLYL